MKPTEYEIQKIARRRGLSNGKYLKRLKAGVIGENTLYQHLKDFGSEHWVILRNVWLHDDSDLECDFILVTSHRPYVFEVKNYYGKFIYEHGKCSSRGVDIPYNPINQARNATIHLKNITRKYSHSIEVKGALVFIGKHNQVHIRDNIDYIDILASNDVYQFIQEIICEEEQAKGMRIDPHDLAAHYLRYQIEHPHLSTPYTNKEIAKAKTGVFCANCQQPVQMKRHKYITCPCGLSESKEEAIVRTACEYGVLTYGANFTVSDIRKFLGGYPSTDYLKKILKKHFEIVTDSKILTFRNLNREFSIVANQFHFDLPRIMVDP